MNYVNYENIQEILDGIERKIGQGGTGSGLEDWQAEHEYSEKDICVYEGQIYRAKVGYTSDTTFSTTQILEEYEHVGGETIIPYEQDTEISINDIVSYDNNTYKALYDFVCGEEFSLFALEEYVPQELTEVQEAEIINHFLPNIYSGGNMSIEDSTPIGTIISFMGTIAPENYLVCDGETYNIVDYIELAEFIKTQFGSYNYFGGDGITTFAVPDLQGEFLRMTGTNSHSGNGSGENVGVHQDGTAFTLLSLARGQIKVLDNSNVNDNRPQWSDSTTTMDSSGTISYKGIQTNLTASTGSSEELYTSRPTNTSVLYCIKYKISITNAEEIKDLTTEDIKQIVNSYNPVFEEAKGVVYSTEERRIGTWIDGKPLYQKTYSGTSENAEYTTISNIDGQIIDKIIYAWGGVRLSNVDWSYDYEIPTGFYGGTAYISPAFRDRYGNIVMKASQDYYNLPYIQTIQYTKTTD